MFISVTKMSKWKQKGAVQGSLTEQRTPGQENREKNRTRFYKRVEKKRKEKKTLHLPPKNTQEFSANWKILLNELSSKRTAEPEKNIRPKAENRKPQKPQLAIKNKKTAQRTDKDVNKPGRGPQENISTPSHGPEEAGAQRDGTGPSVSGRDRAEKRTVRDRDGIPEARIKRKKKVDEVETKPVKPDIWFDDVDPDVLEATLGSEALDAVKKRTGETKSGVETERALVKEGAFDGLTRAVAMDCEMVGVGPGGDQSMLARVSIVNQFGKCVYDKFVKPTEKVTDYRTAVSGIRPTNIENGEDVRTVQKEVAEILDGRVLVGHAVHNDLKVLLLDHPKKNIRDTQKYIPFKKIGKSSRPSLRVICEKVLNVKVQQGEHSSVQDAQATMRLYTLVKVQWEAELKANRGLKSSRRIKAKS